MNIISDILSKQAKAFGPKLALSFHDQQVNFLQLSSQVYRLANGLKGLGVQKGDKVAVCLPNSLEFVYTYLAGFVLGAVVVPLDYMLKTDELVSCLNHSESKIFIVQAKPDIDLATIQTTVASLKQILLLGPGDCNERIQSLTELLSRSASDPLSVDVKDTDPALIMYTSGTTGAPKGILLNVRHLSGSPEAMKHFVDLSPRDIKLAAIPFSHIGGFIYIQNCLWFGITLIIMDRFNPYEFLRLVQQYQVTCFHIVPAMYTALLSLKQIEKFNLSSLRWVVVFGAPSSPEIMERFHKYCPNAQLLNGWGMTETCPPNTVTPLGSKNIASIGKASPICEIKIVDESGAEVPSGTVGEMIIRGWIIMDGYYKDPQTTQTMLRNGWLYTGDLGRKDSEGYLYIMGRKKEMIKVAGQIVYAPEVESALLKHEGIQEAAVIGVKDDLRGEVVKAFVVLKEGIPLTAEDIRYFAKDHLANFKVPQAIEIRAQLPKNRTGKVDKELLKSGPVTNRKEPSMQKMIKEVHMTGRDLMGMVQLRPQDVGPFALVPGPKERLDAIIKKLENPIKNFSFMEYNMYTGGFNGTKVTAINGGRFAADTGITTEILCNAQPKAMIRLGSCGALRDDIKVGDLIVVDSCFPGEGVTPYYVDKNFKTVSDSALTAQLIETAKASGSTVHVGKCWSTDAILRETREHVGKAVNEGAIAVDMVSSVFLTIAQLYKVPAAVILAVSDNVITGEMGFMNTDYYMAEGTMINIAFNWIKQQSVNKVLSQNV